MSIITVAVGSIGKIFNKGTDILVRKVDNYFDNNRATNSNDRVIKIKLEELSSIWLKYNNTFISEDAQKKQQTAITLAPGNASEATPDNNTPDNTTKQETHGADVTKGEGGHILSAEANNFYTDCIEPYKTVLDSRHVLEKVKKLVEIVDLHGNCPSLVITKEYRDEESDDLFNIAGLLAKVTAKNHTFRVVRIATRLTKNEYGLPDAFIPPVIIAALGHDIGKFPEFRVSEAYQKLDHPIISAKIVETVLPPTEITWMNNVLDAIRSHHSNNNNNNDNVLMVLKDADGRAREEEVTSQSPALKIIPLREWFNAKEFLDMIRPHINVTQTNNRWGAFSHDGVVYVNPDFMFQLINDYALKKEVINIQLIQKKNLEKFVKEVVKILYENALPTPDMKENWYYKRYSIETQMNKKIPNINLIPLIENNFNNVDEIERVKDAISDNILKVELKK